MNIIFSMCLAGSVLFLLYLLVLFVLKNQLSNCWRYYILRFVVFFFLTPLGVLKLIPSSIFPETDFKVTGTLPIVVSTPRGLYQNFTYRMQHFIVFIWIIMAVTIFIRQQIKYARLKRVIQKSLTEITDLKLPNEFAYRKNVVKNGKVRFFQSNYTGPFTTGVFLPFIILPADLPAEKQELVLKHELTHIRRCDTLFLFLLHLVVCFYWFNPLVYLLENQVEKVVETSCDEFVIWNMDSSERKRYVSLIIDMAARDVQYRNSYGPSFSSPADILKERINLIMTSEKKRRIHKKLSAVLAVAMILCSSVTAFAYQPSIEFDVDCDYSDNSLWNISPSDTIAFQSGISYQESFVNLILFDDQFTDIHGNIYKIENSGVSDYSVCEHNYVDGTFSKHSKKSTGGCTVRYYDAQRCTKCGHLVTGRLFKTETYESCPH